MVKTHSWTKSGNKRYEYLKSKNFNWILKYKVIWGNECIRHFVLWKKYQVWYAYLEERRQHGPGNNLHRQTERLTYTLQQTLHRIVSW